MCGTTGNDKSDGRVLLPGNVVPNKYNIRLVPDMEKFTYTGEQTVSVNVTEAGTRSVTMHSKSLYIPSCCFKGVGEATGIAFNLKLSTVCFTFDADLPVGEGELMMKFEGVLNDQMAGFYRSEYSDVNGNKKMMLSTQFEALDARRCFPCWDEPALKAVFEMTLVIPDHLEALSNMPEASRGSLAGGKTEVKFMPSPSMSTYLLAMCVGEFDFIQGITKGGVSIRVFTTPGRKHLGTFALDVAIRTLDFYDSFFNVPYPLPKLDMIAIPAFAMGAMENWGLVTYRETALLIDEGKSSSAERQRVCIVITHELAHQWFGNLVTMQWWDDLWLNEGFASWTENYAADYLFPDWDMWQQFTTDAQAAALRLDSLKTSHPIQVPIGHAEEVEEVFDAISYCKGACVVKMLHAVLGAEDFQKGLQLYMERHQYGNTETYHLWSAWTEVSGKNIGEIMGPWTQQMGHPLVEVVKETWKSDSVELSLKQRWFLADGSSDETSADSKLWNIPLIIAASGSTSKPTLEMMTKRTLTVTVPLPSPDSYVMLNAGQHTLMRVAYSTEMIDRLCKGIRSRTLPSEDRAGVIADAYALCKARILGAPELLKLLSAYAEETDYTVWSSVAAAISGLDSILIEDATTHKKFSAFVLNLVKPSASRIGWDSMESDGHLGKLLRGVIVGLLGDFASEDEDIKREASSRFSALLEDFNTPLLPSDYIADVYKLILKSGGQTEFGQVKGLLDVCTNDAERKHIYNSLGHASTSELKKEVLMWTLNEVKLQDFFYPMGSVSRSGKVGRVIAWEFFQENFDALRAKLSAASPSLMDAVIVYCCGGWSDPEMINKIEAFFKEHPLPQNDRKINQMLESMRINAEFGSFVLSSDVKSDTFWTNL